MKLGNFTSLKYSSVVKNLLSTCFFPGEIKAQGEKDQEQ